MSDDIFRVLYMIGLAVGSLIRARYMRQHRENRTVDRRETWLGKLLVAVNSMGLLILPLIYVLTPWLGFADYRLPMWAGWIGVVIFASGLLLLWRSHADLGRSFSPFLEIMEGHSLVTEGVFRYIRHPIYAAHALWAVAQPFLLQNWIAGFAMMVTFLPTYAYRVPREEQMMLDRFGEAYRLYMERTGRIVPRLGRKNHQPQRESHRHNS